MGKKATNYGQTGIIEEVGFFGGGKKQTENKPPKKDGHGITEGTIQDTDNPLTRTDVNSKKKIGPNDVFSTGDEQLWDDLEKGAKKYGLKKDSEE